MMRTFSARLRNLSRSSIGFSARSLASDAGDTLIEVVVSALLLGLIVVGTLTGLNSANRATSLDRARSQADALAQQDEDQLRSEPINKLSELSETHEAVLHEVDAGGTTYKISSTAKYVADSTATASCTSTSEKADYIQTASKVTWGSLGTGKPVVETSIISPPADSALIVQVTGASGEAVPNMNVTATGPTNISTTTSADGCAILAVLPGEYKLNVNKLRYVDPNGYENSDEDPPLSASSLYVVAETTVKKGYEFAEAGALEVSFENSSTKLPTVGDSFMAVNTAMSPTSRTFPKVWTGTYTEKLSSPKTIFPFTSNKYSVYAGTCEADNPHVVNSANAEPTAIGVSPGETAKPTVGLPPVNIEVMSGTEAGANKGTPVVGATGIITDKGCGTTRSFTTAAGGVLPHPNLPFGKYTLCVESAGRKWESNEFANNTTAGPFPENWTEDGLTAGKAAIIYMGTSPSGTPSHTSPTSPTPCP
ncbi:MAG TPA: carboxypeptidase-like regulatory domain-containing protein [Solirubrobacteraceae bacterium]